ncbi:MAG: PAS domain S-box protein [Gemmatimonadaceae bacterium]
MNIELSRPGHDNASPFVPSSQLLPPLRRAAASTALSGAEYRALVEHSPVMIWRARPDGLCDYFNEPWLAFTGRTLEQEVGEGSAADVHPDDLAHCAERYLEAFHKHEEFEMEYRLRRHDGVYRWITNRGMPLFSDDGAFQGFIGSCVDVHERRQAQLEHDENHQHTLNLYHELRVREAKIRRLIDANIVGVVFSDLEARLVEANDAFLGLLGYTNEDISAGRLHWSELTPVEWRDVSERAAAQLRDTESCDLFEKEYFHRDGRRVPVLVGIATIGEERNATVAFVLDRTEAKRAEQERERLHQTQAELAYMSRVLTMGELAASIAHDIKQPISAALASAEASVLLLDRPEPDLTNARDAAAQMSAEVKRANAIIDRLRALYTRGAPRKAPVDMNDLVREMVALLDSEATKRGTGIRLELEPTLPLVTGDRVQLQQVLLNLMLNAIEATDGGAGELFVRTECTDEGRVLIAISDSGVGLPFGNTERIFDAFFTTKPQGMGMGLGISRAIVEAHGGTLSAMTNPTAGSTFQFTLPN